MCGDPVTVTKVKMMPQNVYSKDEVDALLAPILATQADHESRIAALEGGAPPPPPPPPSGDLGDFYTVASGETLTINSTVTVGTLTVEGTLILQDGAEIVIKDIPSTDPDKLEVGVIVQNGGVLRYLGDTTIPPDSTNLIRAAKIRSANPTGNRGHLMVHMGGMLDIGGLAIVDLGRTTLAVFDDVANHIGRYACHLHMLGNTTSRIEGCAIYDTVPASQHRYGVTIHGTNNAIVKNNIIVNKAGAGIFTEDGTEQGNVIEGNVAEDVQGDTGNWDSATPPTRPDNRGVFMESGAFAGYGFAFRGPKNIVRNNVARRCKVGFIYYQMWSPTRNDPIAEFSGNLSDQCFNGLETWFIGGMGFDFTQTQRSTFTGFTARNLLNYGVFSYDQHLVTYDNFTLEGCSIYQADYMQNGFILQNSTFTGNASFIASTVTVGELLIDNCDFNGGNIVCPTLWSSGSGSGIPPRRVRVKNCLLANGSKLQLGETLVGGSRNWIQLDEVLVEDFQRVLGDSFRAYANEQDAGFILPQSSGSNVGSPDAGLTNQQNWGTYGIAWAGAVTPGDATTRVEVVGKVK